MRFAPALVPAIVSDETNFSAQGVFVDGSNVRPRGERMETIGGWTEAYASPVTGVCRNVISWLDRSTLSNIAFGTHSKLMVLKSGVLSDITPTGLSTGNISRVGGFGYGRGGYGTGGYGGGALAETYPRTWAFDNWGPYLIANPRGKGIYVWQNAVATPATRITQAPTSNGSILVNSLRQIMSFGCNEVLSNVYNPMMIRGCDFEDYTTWTPTTSNNAFELTLEGGGRITGRARMGSYIAVWTDTSVFLGQYTGSALAPWRFDLVADNCGLAGPNAVVVVNQAAYWLTPDLQFYAWALGSPPAPMECTIRNDFKDNIDTYEIDKVACTSVSEFNEIWWFYPDARDTEAGDSGENSRYVAISLNGGRWFRGLMERTAAIDSGPSQYPVFVDPDGMVFYHENGSDANGAALDWFIETGDLYIDEAQRRVMVKGFWPDFEAQESNVSLVLKTKSYPQAEARFRGPYTLAPGREKRDFMVDTRIAAMKLSGSAAGTFMRMGKPSFDFELSGER